MLASTGKKRRQCFQSRVEIVAAVGFLTDAYGLFSSNCHHSDARPVADRTNLIITSELQKVCNPMVATRVARYAVLAIVMVTRLADVKNSVP